MNFKIDNPYDKHKKKTNKSQIILICLAVFFLILSIILIIIQNRSIKNSNKTVPSNPVRQIGNENNNDEPEVNENERPIAVMIDNNIGDEEQAGLQDSYINYEIIVEGGLTRIMAIFKNNDNVLIGPVRSARNYFLDYALENDAIYAHYGWSPNTESDIKSLNVDNINGMTSSSPFRRDTTLKAPHNVFTTTTYLKNYIDETSFRTTSDNWKLLNESESEVNLDELTSIKDNTQQAEKITINYSYYQNRSYTYDSVNKYYLKSINGSAQKDKKTDSQLHYKNVIIEYVDNKSIDDEDRQELTTTGKGTGYYITNGYATKINWTKSTRSDKTIYKYQDGTELKINEGNTFINIVPTDNLITIE